VQVVKFLIMLCSPASRHLNLKAFATWLADWLTYMDFDRSQCTLSSSSSSFCWPQSLSPVQALFEAVAVVHGSFSKRFSHQNSTCIPWLHLELS